MIRLDLSSFIDPKQVETHESSEFIRLLLLFTFPTFLTIIAQILISLSQLYPNQRQEKRESKWGFFNHSTALLTRVE